MYIDDSKLLLYKDYTLPNIVPSTGYRIHKTSLNIAGASTYHTHEYYEVFLVMKGKCKHYANGNTINIEQGDLAFIRPFDKHCTYDNKSAEYINLAFGKEHSDAIFSYFKGIYNFDKLINAKDPAVVHLLPNDLYTLNKKLEDMRTITFNDISTHKLRVRRLLSYIIPLFFKKQNTDHLSKTPFWLSHMYNEIQKPENFTQGVKCLSLISDRTPEHINRCLKKFYNVTSTKLLLNLKLNYAINLLTTTNMKIIDIAYEAGFLNTSYFYTVFKNVYNETPKEFRQKFFDTDIDTAFSKEEQY